MALSLVLRKSFMAAPAPDAVERARTRLRQAQVRLNDLNARARGHERKVDTRRKIILGGLLIDAATKSADWNDKLTELLGRISRDNDHQAFAGWSINQES